MTHSDPLPFGVTLTRISKEDLHYLQRSARRQDEEFEDVLHRIIQKHRYPGGAGECTKPKSTNMAGKHAPVKMGDLR